MLLEYFTDPILRGPTIASLFIGISTSIIGILCFYERRSLIGEVLSHAAFPGIIIGLFLGMFQWKGNDLWIEFSALFCAFLSSLMALYCLHFLKNKALLSDDSALCFILSGFFGLGILGSSLMQQINPVGFRSIQSYLFGQTATLSDKAAYFYGGFAVLLIALLALFYRFFQLILFDKRFAESLGFKKKRYTVFYQILIALTVVVGVRCVGVVLLSSLLITPAVFARGFSKKLSSCFVMGAVFGALVSCVGVILSLELPPLFGIRLLPTGPFIVTLGTLLATLSLFYRKKWRQLL